MTAWLRLHRLIRELTGTTWDEAAWPKAKWVLGRALRIRRKLARGAWWN